MNRRLVTLALAVGAAVAATGCLPQSSPIIRPGDTTITHPGRYVGRGVHGTCLILYVWKGPFGLELGRWQFRDGGVPELTFADGTAVRTSVGCGDLRRVPPAENGGYTADGAS
jgi:hypothetical protein